VESLDELRERRDFECRLTPDRALETLDEAEAFLRDRGLLTRTADSSLPSLYEACHEEVYSPGSPGFAEWPRTRWPWFGELGERGYTILAVHRGKNVVVTDEVAGVLDPICRAEIERMRAADPDWRRLLDHLAGAEAAAIPARALRRRRLALARGDRGAGTCPFERAFALGSGLLGPR